MPQLQDPNFRRSVVLLVQHDETGTFGLVLNRPAQLSASDLCRGIECRWSGEPDALVYQGGPVQENTGWVLFQGQDLRLEFDFSESFDDVTEVGADGLLFAGSIDVLRAVAESPPRDLRLFLGYAGWGPGQLEREMAAGAWIVAPLSVETIFQAEPDAMWDLVVRGLGVDPVTLIATPGVH